MSIVCLNLDDALSSGRVLSLSVSAVLLGYCCTVESINRSLIRFLMRFIHYHQRRLVRCLYLMEIETKGWELILSG